MRIRVDERFALEVAEVDLRYRCPDCAYFVPASAGCAHEWPNALHLVPTPGGPDDVVFCKEFESA